MESEVVVVEETLVLVEAAAQVVLSLLVATVDGQVVGMLEGMVLEQGLVPAVVSIALDTVDELLDIVLRVLGGLSGVGAHLVCGVHPGEDVHLGGKGRRETESEQVGILYGRRTRATLLGGNEYDAVLGTDTVDGSGGILQHGNALDVFWIQLGERLCTFVGISGVPVGGTALCGSDDAVDDDHRAAVAAKAEVGVEVTGAAALLADHQARDLALQGCDDVRLLGHFQLLAPDIGDGTGQ